MDAAPMWDWGDVKQVGGRLVVYGVVSVLRL